MTPMYPIFTAVTVSSVALDRYARTLLLSRPSFLLSTGLRSLPLMLNGEPAIWLREQFAM